MGGCATCVTPEALGRGVAERMRSGLSRANATSKTAAYKIGDRDDVEFKWGLTVPQ